MNLSSMSILFGLCLSAQNVFAEDFDSLFKPLEVKKKSSLFERRSVANEPTDSSGTGSLLLQSELEKNLQKFKNAKNLFDQKKYSEALTHFKELSSNPNFDLQDYSQYFLSQIYVQMNNSEEAEKALKKLEELKPNLRLQTLASESLGILYLDQKKYKESLQHLAGLEKKSRNTEIYPEIIFHLARAEKGLGKKTAMCQWLLKLYEKYPQYQGIQSWGSDLTETQFDGEPTGCNFGLENFKTRMRNLSLSGQLKRSWGEIEQLKKRGQLADPFPMVQLEAIYHMYDGNPQKSQELLKPLLSTRKRDISFLQIYGSAASRAGDFQLAVGIYYQIAVSS